jgi:hypothetical protein
MPLSTFFLPDCWGEDGKSPNANLFRKIIGREGVGRTETSGLTTKGKRRLAQGKLFNTIFAALQKAWSHNVSPEQLLWISKYRMGPLAK